MTVIGVATDFKRYALTDTTRPEMIVPFTQKPYPTFSTLQFVVRSPLPAGRLVPEIQRAVAAVDPMIPVSRVRSIDDLIIYSSTSARFAARFMIAFGASALFLAIIGLYGVIAYHVLQRRQEFGVRRALGASAAQILRLVAREAAVLTMIGSALGIAVALGAGFAIRGLLYGVVAYDPTTLTATVGNRHRRGDRRYRSRMASGANRASDGARGDLTADTHDRGAAKRRFGAVNSVDDQSVQRIVTT